jgi:hypothetical protein
MATKQHLIDRIEHVKSLIEENGKEFTYDLPKKFKKDDLFIILNKAHDVYKEVRK